MEAFLISIVFVLYSVRYGCGHWYIQPGWVLVTAFQASQHVWHTLSISFSVSAPAFVHSYEPTSHIQKISGSAARTTFCIDTSSLHRCSSRRLPRTICVRRPMLAQIKAQCSDLLGSSVLDHLAIASFAKLSWALHSMHKESKEEEDVT